MPSPVTDRYHALLREEALEKDEAQLRVAGELERLTGELEIYGRARSSGLLGRLFSRKPKPGPPRGVYLWGSVGRGKTMLMDLFFELAPVHAKRRVHFQSFMADVHQRIHAWRLASKAGTARGDEPVAPIADDLAAQAWLLCFDEFTVTDIADAMILGRLFQALFARGVVIVATSNVEPGRLYEGGLNRALFLPSIRQIQQHMQVCELDAPKDFRLEKLAGAPVYHVPADAAAHEALTRAFKSLTGRSRGEPRSIELLGRQLIVPQAVHGVARFSFHDLCEQPLGSSDYLAIAREFHTVVIDDIPVLPANKRNEARRLTWLIDALYDMQVKVIASAQAQPIGLYLGTEGREVFEFERTASRLIEMRSTDYLALPHGARGRAEAAGAPESAET